MENKRERLSMDFGWKFHLGHSSDASRDFEFGSGDPNFKTKAGDAVGAARPDFDDSKWRKIDLPHDWAVELDFDAKAERYHGYRPLGREWPATSIGWYRKTFKLAKSDEGKRLSIEFDGIFRDSIIWLNGHFLGRHMSGYTSFRYDISDYVNYGHKNVLVVRVDASQFEGWFYEGAGIYRHVWLVKTDPLHVAHWGIFVTSEVNHDSAKVIIKTKISNEYDEATQCQVISTIVDADEKAIGKAQSTQTVRAWENKEFIQQVTVKNPRLWSIESPYLYRLVTMVKKGDTAVDAYETSFGIRTIRFDAHKGFFLNGKPLKIKGICCHQYHAGVSTALPERIHEFRIEKLKKIGCNAIRCAHNPPAPELLDACDRLGMLVIDENRMMGSSPELLGQLESMILRDRNHPSVILWCLGNEEHVIQGTEVGARISSTMKRLVKRLDPSRSVTLAMNGEWGSVVSLIMDVQGCNYIRCGDVDKYHKDHPDHPIMATETASTLSTRGIYANDKEKGYANAYGTTLPPWGSTAEDMWRFWAERPFVSGVFIWAGFDYGGEAELFWWPGISTNFGIMDTCGFPKDNYYYYKAWWSEETVLHIFPHWNWKGREGEEIDVWSYSNCEEAELFLNGKSLGKKKMRPNSHLEWKVKYAPGKLEAKGYRSGKEITTAKAETTGKPAKLKLTPNRLVIKADNEDISVVKVSVLDTQGRAVPTTNNQVTFSISKNARIIGVGNGDPSSHEPDKTTKRKVFNGRCQVIIQSGRETGEIKLTAESPGLRSTSIIIRAENCISKPFVPSVPC